MAVEHAKEGMLIKLRGSKYHFKVFFVPRINTNNHSSLLCECRKEHTPDRPKKFKNRFTGEIIIRKEHTHWCGCLVFNKRTKYCAIYNLANPHSWIWLSHSVWYSVDVTVIRPPTRYEILD